MPESAGETAPPIIHAARPGWAQPGWGWWWTRRVGRLLGLAVMAYGFWVVALWGLQERMIFPRELAGPGRPAPPGVIVLQVAGDDGSTIPAWLHLPPRLAPGQRVGVAVYFHGNGETVDQGLFDPALDPIRASGLAVLGVEYRGYGLAGGRPSQAAIVRDSLALIELALQRPELDPERVVYVGRSLGGGVACAVAAIRPPRGMVLLSTFSSMGSMAHRFGAPAWLVRHPFPSDQTLPRFDGPVLFLHGLDDTVVPIEEGRALARVARHGRFIEQPGQHMDLPTDARAWAEAVRAWLVETGVAGPATRQEGQ